jgi:hypothetical protein
MAPLPRSVIADGNAKVSWVPAIADPAAPTLAELNAASAVELSCYLTGFTPGTDESTITDDRLCAPQVFQRPGSHTDSMSWTYVYQPQAKGTTPAVTDNEAQDTLVNHAAGYIVFRWGKDAMTAFASGDVVDVYPAEAGVQRKQAPERNATLKIEQTMYVTGPVQRDVLVVAGA